MKQHLILILLSLLLWGTSLQAEEYRRLGQDYRSLAMGNTGIVTANGSSAMFYNPAALANIFTWWVDIPMFELTYSDDAKDLVDAAKTGGFSLDTQQDQLDFMDTFIGLNPYVKSRLGANFLANFSNKGFTMGYNYNYEALLDLHVRNPSMPEINGLIRLDQVRQVGASIPLGMGQFIMGVTYKSVERNEADFSYSMADALNEKKFPSLARVGVQGAGTGYDVGFLFRQDSKSRLMFGGVYRSPIDMGDATSIPGESAFGLGMVHELTIFRWIAAVDFRDVTYEWGALDDASLARRTHAGMELGLFPISKTHSLISLRTGISQGYQSKGAELMLGHLLVLGATRYTEETGEYAGQKGSDRNVIYISLGF